MDKEIAKEIATENQNVQELESVPKEGTNRRKDANGMIDYLHEQVWSRFVRMPYGHLLDYADTDGNTCFPTAKECEKAMPNPMGWWTSIENGSFFTGLYTYALLEKYRKTKDPSTADEIKILVDGLLYLQDVGTVDGFIARGVADDGKSHFPCSSDDQFFPWVLSLFAYYSSDLCENPSDIRERLLRALRAVRSYGWRIPADVKGLYTYAMEEAADWRGIVPLLFYAKVIYELTREEADEEIFRNFAISKPAGSIFTRLEIVSHGYSHDMVAFLGVKQFWICTCSHLAIREMILLDPKHSEYYKKGLHQNGVTSLGIVDDILKYDNVGDGFTFDWRSIHEFWKYYEGDIQKGVQIAITQHAYWTKEVVPHRVMEHEVLGNALFASWMAITCGDDAIAECALQKLKTGCQYVHWESLHLCYAFVAESGLLFS